MSTIKSLLLKLSQLSEEANLQAHLFEMDLKDDWLSIKTRVRQLETKWEAKLLEICERIGHFEEAKFITDEPEIMALIDEIKKLKEKTINHPRP